jgi:hypothetical protein
MITVKDHKTLPLFDPWGFLGPKRRQLLDDSWAGLFREYILPILPVDKIAPFFNQNFGRPTKELNTVLGVLILQQTHDLTDEETIYQSAFNVQWHYALNIPEESDAVKYICPKTLFNMRKIIIENGLDNILFNETTDALAKAFDTDPSKQRIDSVHIKSNMKRLGRIGIFNQSICKFLTNLKRHHRGDFDELPEELTRKYLPEKGEKGCFSQVKPSESEKTLKTVSSDLYELIQKFTDRKNISSMHSFKLLGRVLKEQCIVKESADDNGEKVSVRPPKEISSSSLQNPSDPDASYSGHKGQGYQVQVMETFCDEDDEQIREQTLNLITYVEAGPACNSDTNALMPAINSVKERNLLPGELSADALYGGQENVDKASAEGVKLIAPTMGATEKLPVTLSDFEFSDNNEVCRCPQNQKPVSVRKSKKRNCSASFDSSVCRNCPRKKDCPVKEGKKHHYLRYSEKSLRISQRRTEEQSEKFKEKYRWRAGVEATMSEYNTRTGVKHLRVRGVKNVQYCARLKAVGVNIFRATAVRNARKRGKSPFADSLFSYFGIFLTVKEQIRDACDDLSFLSHNHADDYKFCFRKAA